MAGGLNQDNGFGARARSLAPSPFTRTGNEGGGCAVEGRPSPSGNSVQGSNCSQAQGSRELYGDDSMRDFRGSYARKVRGDSRRSLRAIPNGEECRAFQRKQFAKMEAGEIAEIAGCTKRAAENIRAGENNIQMKFLVAMLRNDPALRASFFEFCGGQLQFPPDVTAALGKAASWFQSMEMVDE